MSGIRSHLVHRFTVAACAGALTLAGCAPSPPAQPAAPTQAPAKPAATTQPAVAQPTAAPATPAAAAKPAPTAQPAAGQPVSGGTLTIAYVALVTHIDPNSVNTSTANEQAHYFYETLFDRDAGGKVVPLLVKEEQVSPDGLTVTWKLQPDVKFHDGTPFNAAAVKWNLERKIAKKQPLYDFLPINSIEAVDDLTVRVGLTRPTPGMSGTLTTKTFSMYSPTFSEKEGDDGLKLRASGTGPFTVGEYNPNEVLRLKKNPEYWQKGLPHLDEIVFRVVPDINTRATMLAAGDIDMALNLSIPDIQRFKSAPGIKVLEGLGSQQSYITINNQRPPLNDIKVRQALNHAVDKEGIIKTVFLGSGTPATAIYINPTVDGYAEAGTYPYDPERAKALLDEAGFKMGAGGLREKDGKPLTLELLTRKGGAAGDYETAELVQAMLTAVGIELKLTVLEAATFIQRVTKPVNEADYDLVNLQVGTFTGDAEYTMLTFYHTDSFAPKYFNRAYYSNPAVDKLIDESKKAATRAERDRLYAQVTKQVFSDAPIIALFDVFQAVGLRDTVHGVYLEGAGNNFPAKYAWKEKR